MDDNNSQFGPSCDDPFFTGSGVMNETVRTFAWGTTPLGAQELWPVSLKSLVSVLLASRQPMFMAWGPDRTWLYNDAFIPILGLKHPRALGRPSMDVWAEARDILEPMFDRVYAGESVSIEDFTLDLDRNGEPEEAHFEFAYTPARDDRGAVAGLFGSCIETTSRVRAERRQAAATQRQKQQFQSAPGFIAILGGADHVYEFVNDAYVRLLGDRQFIGRPVIEVAPEVAGQGFIELLDRVYCTGERYVAEELPITLERFAGDTAGEYFLSFVYEPVRDDLGMVSGIFVEGFDVTSGVLERQARQASEARFRGAVEAVEGVLWTNNAEGRMTGEQPGWTALTGQEPSAYDGYGWAAAVHPDDAESTVLAWRDAVSGRRPFVFEHRVRRKDGEWRTFSIHAIPSLSNEGEILEWVGVHTDITEQRLAEERLRELNATLEQRVADALAERKVFADIVEGTDALVLVVDLDFRLLAINRPGANEFERVYGVRPQVGTSLLASLHDRPEHEQAVRRMWARALAGEEFSEVEEFGDPKFDRRAYEVKFNTLRDAKGAQIGAFQFVTDVTHRVVERRRLAQAEEQARQSQKMEAMGQLTGGVAHDFNNLLMPIIGSLDMLQRRSNHDARTARMIDGGLQAAERAKTLVQRLLAFARRQPLQPQAVDIGQLILGMVDLVTSTSGPRIRVMVDVDHDLPAAFADSNQLEMALLNLAVNGRDAMPDGGTLRIAARLESRPTNPTLGLASGRYVCISVADTGVGMDAATAARATEPFFSTKGIGRGTGLGLSMAHGLAAQLGGTLTLQSEPGAGTNIEIWLPIAAAPAAALPLPTVTDLAARSGTALLVDDEDIVRASTLEMLTELGYAVVDANSAEAAEALVIGGLVPDVLVTDHLMPGMTGLNLIAALRKRLPDLPALIISGYAEVEGVAPEFPRLTKPFRQRDLAKALATILDGRAVR